MKGRVYKRGKSWYYRFDIEPDPLTGKASAGERERVSGQSARPGRNAGPRSPTTRRAAWSLRPAARWATRWRSG